MQPGQTKKVGKQDNGDIIELTEQLIRLCGKRRVLLTGFLVSTSDPPLLLHFGTVKESGDDLVALHEKLIGITGDGRSVVRRNVRARGDA